VLLSGWVDCWAIAIPITPNTIKSSCVVYMAESGIFSVDPGSNSQICWTTISAAAMTAATPPVLINTLDMSPPRCWPADRPHEKRHSSSCPAS
jgi:hypothetical protein